MAILSTLLPLGLSPFNPLFLVQQRMEELSDQSVGRERRTASFSGVRCLAPVLAKKLFIAPNCGVGPFCRCPLVATTVDLSCCHTSCVVPLRPLHGRLAFRIGCLWFVIFASFLPSLASNRSICFLPCFVLVCVLVFVLFYPVRSQISLPLRSRSLRLCMSSSRRWF